MGSSVLKAHDGTYRTLDYPSQDQIDASAVTYLGGHIYEINADEAAALITAGYIVDTVGGGYGGAYPGGY